MTFRTRRRKAARHSRDAVLNVGNVIASAFDFLSELEEGRDPSEAFDTAYQRGKRRKRALRTTDHE